MYFMRMNAPLVSRRTALRAAAGSAALAGAGPLVAAPVRAAERPPILKPLPAEYFIDFGTNAEMRWDAAGDLGDVVDAGRFFVRNHTRTPIIDARTWRLRVHGDGLRGRPRPADPVTLSYAELKAMPSRTVTRAVECTGNGRSFFDTQQGTPVSGTAWQLGAIGVAQWRGVPLRSVLERIGLRADAVDVMATGLDDPYVSGGRDYGRVRRPISVDKALDDTLLAYEMNGAPLLRDHGFPVRLLVPGWIGIASIKWLGSLRVSTVPLYSPWNTEFYRMTGGDYAPDSPPLTAQRVKSAFELARGAEIPLGERTVLRGRSWSGLGAVRGVEVSADAGVSWLPAHLTGPNLRSAWSRWRLPWTPTVQGATELLARATDSVGRRQPDSSPYNANGYLFDAVVRHPVTVA